MEIGNNSPAELALRSQTFYAATANLEIAQPKLEGEIEADVCVIGGGFAGIATALSLAERNVKVVLLEADRVGSGASGKNGGQVLEGWSGEDALVSQIGDTAARFFEQTRYLGHDIIERRIKQYGIACDYVKGALTVALNANQMRSLAKSAKNFDADMHGHKLKLLDRAELGEHIGSPLFCGGLLDERGAHCHPLNLCLGETKASIDLGVEIFESSPVLSVEPGAINTVITSHGSVVAPKVVLAGNAYHELYPENFRSYMLPAQTYIIATEPLSEELAHSVLPSNKAVCDARWVLDYFRLSADRRLLFGGECTYNNRAIEDVRRVLGPRMTKVFPQLKDVAIEHQWGGTIGIPINRIPMIGRINESIFYAQGFSGHGVNCSHIVGEILSDAVMGDTQIVDMFERARHVFVPASAWLGGPLLALGMSFFRFRDFARV